MLLAIATVGAGSPIAQAPESGGGYTSKVVQDVKRANELFYEAWKKRDLWAMSRIWAKADYVSAIHPGRAEPFLNWDNVRDSWKRTFDHNRDIEIHSLAGTLHVVGDVAWVIDSTRLEAIQTQTGQPILLNNILATKIFESDEDRWFLVHYHAHLPKLVPLTDTHDAPQRGEAASTLPKAVEQANEAFYVAWSNGDVAEMSKVWAKADYASAIHSDAAIPLLGWGNVKKGWQAIFARNRAINVRGRAKARHMSGNIAWVVESTEFEIGWTENGQSAHKDEFLTTKIFERHGDEWLLVHFHAHVGSSPLRDNQHGHDHAH